MKPHFLIAFSLILAIACSETSDQVASKVYKWDDLSVKEANGITTREMVSGPSPHFDDFEIKVLTFYTDSMPKTFKDDYENVLIVKQGVMLLEVAGEKTLLGSKSVAQIMPGQEYAIYSNEPVTYYLLRYRSKKGMDLTRATGNLVLNRDSLEFKPSEKGGGTKYFDRATPMCERYEMHTTLLNREGPSHKGHTHDETEIILVISGETSMTIGEEEYFGKSGDLYLMTSGIYHQVNNASNQPCEYFAFKWK